MALPPDHNLPRAILFDMDGLLFDSETLYRSMFLDLLGQYRLQGTDAHFAKLVGLGWIETTAMLKVDFPGIDAELFITRWKQSCHPDTGLVPELKPGVGALLDLLAIRGIGAAIATGSERAVADGFLAYHSMRHRFQAIVAYEDAERGKPHPDPFVNAAVAIGYAPLDCLVLEDSPNGIRAAHAAGMPAVFVPDMIEPTKEVEQLALGIARDLHEVTDWLGAL